MATTLSTIAWIGLCGVVGASVYNINRLYKENKKLMTTLDYVNDACEYWMKAHDGILKAYNKLVNDSALQKEQG